MRHSIGLDWCAGVDRSEAWGLNGVGQSWRAGVVVTEARGDPMREVLSEVLSFAGWTDAAGAGWTTDVATGIRTCRCTCGRALSQLLQSCCGADVDVLQRALHVAASRLEGVRVVAAVAMGEILSWVAPRGLDVLRILSAVRAVVVGEVLSRAELEVSAIEAILHDGIQAWRVLGPHRVGSRRVGLSWSWCGSVWHRANVSDHAGSRLGNMAHDIFVAVAPIDHSEDGDRGVRLDLLYHLYCRS